jgi:hypothetical protein
MTELSHSARMNPLYFTAFGEASQSEERGSCSSEAAHTLKTKRRRLFNNLMESKKGYERLVTRASNSLDNIAKKADVPRKVFGKITEHSDNEEECVSSDSEKTILNSNNESIPTVRPIPPKNFQFLNDKDMFDTDESYPCQAVQNDKFGRNMSCRGTPPLKSTTTATARTLKRNRPDDDSDDDDEAETDDEDNDENDIDGTEVDDMTDDEEEMNKEIMRLIAMNKILSSHKDSFVESDDWFEQYEDDKWSTKAQPSEADLDFCDICVDEDTDDESSLESSDASSDNSEEISTLWGLSQNILQFVDPALISAPR